MTSINISLKKEAYEFLKSRKSKEKSFSDVILEFKIDKNPLEFFGVLKEKDWKETEENMKSFRMDFNKRMNK